MTLRYCVLAAAMVAITGCSSSKTPSTAQSTPVSTDTEALLGYQSAITESYLRDHLTPFAADSMEGRETGKRGQKKAAQFLARQYKALGMQPVGDNGSYFQRVDLTARRPDSTVFQLFSMDANGQEQQVQQSRADASTTGDFSVLYGGNQIIDAPIVFAGFGIEDAAMGINNFKGTNVSGKWVMVWGSVPQVINGDSLYSNEQQFKQQRLRAILQKGAAGIIDIPLTKEQDFSGMAAENGKSYGENGRMQLRYLQSKEDDDGLAWSYNVIRPAKARQLLQLGDTPNALQNLQNKQLQQITSLTARPLGYGLTQIPYNKRVSIESENVVAYLEGADPQLKDEVVVLSAHYDHVGIGAPDSTGDAIYNGANDDGSGTIGVLSAARAFAEARENGVRPRRSILFLSVTGEEKGLLGSRYYSDHPIFPIKKTVANLNTDMIGRIDPEHREAGNDEYIYIIGGSIISSQMDSLLQAGNRKAGQLQLDMRYNDLTDPNQFYRRSDHWNFGRFGLPFVFFFNGVHEDYHRPSDEVEKMNFPLMMRTARSMYGATVEVANADAAPTVDNQAFIDITKSQAR